MECREDKLLAALATAVERRLIQFIAQEIANAAWALATWNYRDGKLTTDLAKVAKRRLSELNPQNLANAAWAFATVKCRDDKLFAVLARVAERRLSEFHPQGCCQQGMVICNGQLQRSKAMCSTGDSGGAAAEHLQPAQ